jgi:integrase
MNEVEAIKTKDDIAAISALLLKHGSQLYFDIFKVGINVAFRISDLLRIKMNQIDLIRRELTIVEGKTGKKRTVRLNQTALNIINQRMESYPDDEYLFQSHDYRGRFYTNKPIDRSTVVRKFAEVGKMLDIRLGTHSMRKTRGLMLHQAGVSIEHIARVLNHSSPSVTMAYYWLSN